MKWICFSLLRQETQLLKNGGFVEILFLFSTSIFSRFIGFRISIDCIYIEITLNLRTHISQIGNINEEFFI